MRLVQGLLVFLKVEGDGWEKGTLNIGTGAEGSMCDAV